MKRPKILSKKTLTPEEEEEIRKNLRENPITNKDIFAMFLAVFIPVLIVLGIFVLVLWLIFLT